MDFKTNLKDQANFINQINEHNQKNPNNQMNFESILNAIAPTFIQKLWLKKMMLKLFDKNIKFNINIVGEGSISFSYILEDLMSESITLGDNRIITTVLFDEKMPLVLFPYDHEMTNDYSKHYKTQFISKISAIKCVNSEYLFIKDPFPLLDQFEKSGILKKFNNIIYLSKSPVKNSFPTLKIFKFGDNSLLLEKFISQSFSKKFKSWINESIAWTPNINSKLDENFKKTIKTCLMMSLKIGNKPIYEESLWWAIPRDVLYLIFNFMFQINYFY